MSVELTGPLLLASVMLVPLQAFLAVAVLSVVLLYVFFLVKVFVVTFVDILFNGVTFNFLVYHFLTCARVIMYGYHCLTKRSRCAHHDDAEQCEY